MELQVDDLTFEVRHSSRRKTLEIIVDRGGDLVLAAPRAPKNICSRTLFRRKNSGSTRNWPRKPSYLSPSLAKST